jgi:ketopantoate hydroxymethyltransferase
MATGVDAVKLEGGVSKEAEIRAIVQAGIPVQAHIGLLPQKVKEEGGYRMKGKTDAEAEALMLLVHKSGSATVGIYSYDIARSKTNKATAMARNEGFPLRLTISPEN